MLTFISEGSDSAGTLPSLFWETLDSALRMSSRVVWKVDSDMLANIQIVIGICMSHMFMRLFWMLLMCSKMVVFILFSCAKR